jgi:hypothetical protein
VQGTTGRQHEQRQADGVTGDSTMAPSLWVTCLTRAVEGMQGTVLRRAASRLGRLGRVARLTVACADGEVSRLDTNSTTVAAIFW